MILCHCVSVVKCLIGLSTLGDSTGITNNYCVLRIRKVCIGVQGTAELGGSTLSYNQTAV
jgi:hypothetical protein